MNRFPTKNLCRKTLRNTRKRALKRDHTFNIFVVHFHVHVVFMVFGFLEKILHFGHCHDICFELLVDTSNNSHFCEKLPFRNHHALRKKLSLEVTCIHLVSCGFSIIVCWCLLTNRGSSQSKLSKLHFGIQSRKRE